MISLYLSTPTWAHGIPAGIKLLAVALGSLLLFQVTDLRLLGVLLIGMVLLYVSLGPDGFRQLRLIRPLAFFMVVILLMHWLSDTLLAGVAVALRLVVMILAANLVSITTRLDDMLDAVMPIFSPLTWFGWSRRPPALAVALVLRFAPVLMSVFVALQEAFQARTGRRTSWRLVAPFALQSLRMSENVAEALTARGGSAGLAIKLQKSAIGPMRHQPNRISGKPLSRRMPFARSRGVDSKEQ